LRIAIVHEWLVTYAGSERVLEQMLRIFPDADIYSVVDFLPEDQRGFILGKKSKTTFIEKLPFSKREYRTYLPLMPIAVEQFDLTSYDVIISSSHAVAKGVITSPHQLHICMCYSPIRYAWDLQHQYLVESGLNKGLKGIIAKYFLHKIRLWDYRTSNGVDEFIAISEFIAKRIWKVYRRESTIIYPPVDINSFTLKTKKDDYYLTASRMVPYKKIDLIVEAFSTMPNKKLIVIGSGPDYKKIQAKVGPNVSLLGYQSNEKMKEYMQSAKAFIFAAEEDFGIIPIEAQACGTPVVAYGKGGALETVKGLEDDHPTGVFFGEQTIQSIVDAVKKLELNYSKIIPENCRINAERFATARFAKEFSSFMQKKIKAFFNNNSEVVK
jgi:glycosyltransferase involved in cell wall biosynthesis